MDTPIDLVVAAIGSRRQLAQKIGVTPQAVTRWNRKIPAERVLQIEKASGVSRHQLRPDLYPKEGAAA